MQLSPFEILQKKILLFHPSHVPGDLKTLQQFLLLLEENFREEKEAGFYAEKLKVTVWRLGYLIKFHFKISFYELVQQRLHREAELLLQQTTLTIREITFDLGLNDPSYFARYFKKITGLRPVEFRKLAGC